MVFAILAGLYVLGLVTLTALENLYHIPAQPTRSGLLWGRAPYVALLAESYILYQVLTTFSLSDMLATIVVGVQIVLVYAGLAGGVFTAHGSREVFERYEARVGVFMVLALSLCVIVYIMV